jgi:phospholipase C
MNTARRRMWFAAVSILAGVLFLSLPIRSSANDGDDDDTHYYGATKTPIEHVVVIFQENVSFDHYFATYPHATPNFTGPVYFGKPKDDTPRVNGLESGGLLTSNPNFKNTGNAPNNINPFRLDRSQASTCDQGHNYGPEQLAADQGLMDLFPKNMFDFDDHIRAEDRELLLNSTTGTVVGDHDDHDHDHDRR